MKQRYWYIVGYNGTETIFEKKVKMGCFSDDQIEHLLRALTARAGLDCEEIVGAYAKRGTKVSNDLLHVQWDFQGDMLSCGTNPYFIAKVIEDGSYQLGRDGG